MKYAGFWIRLVADILDSILLTLTSWMVEYFILGMVYWIGRFTAPFSDAFNAFTLQLLNIGIYFCIALPYYVIGHYRWGTTLGKKPLKIYVINAHDQASITLRQSVIRFFAYGLSYALFLCGFIMAAFQPEKRALHDLLAGTMSIRKG